MTKADVIAALVFNRDRLRSLGVVHAGVFGSVARRRARTESDIDVLVELAPAKRTVFDLVRIEHAVADIFRAKVHVAMKDQLKPTLRESVLADAAYAF